jgi:hypothetical protein
MSTTFGILCSILPIRPAEFSFREQSFCWLPGLPKINGHGSIAAVWFNRKMSDRAGAALQIAVETTAQAAQVEQENEQLRAQLKKNQADIEAFGVAAPRVRSLQQQLHDKQAEIEQKRKELMALQASIIDLLKNPPESAAPPDSGSLEVIPIVMNTVLKQITDLTEGAIAQKSIGISILAVFKASETLNRLYGTLSEKNIIEESDEEKQERMSKYVTAQREILMKLKAIAARPPEAPAPAPKVEEVPPKVETAEAGTDAAPAPVANPEGGEKPAE